MQGKVKWYNDSKKYGFITIDDTDREVFVHMSEIQGVGYKSLKEGQRVEFEVSDGPKGERASNVRKLE